MKKSPFNRNLGMLLGASFLANPAVNAAAAQTGTGPSSANTVVIHFDLAPDALSGVHNSVELIMAIRDNLMLEASTPLDSELTMQLNARFGRLPDASYAFGSGISVQIQPDQPVSESFSSLPIHTYSDWDESEAWQYFQGETVSGLVNSMASTGGFVIDDNGNVPLTVTAVHTGYSDEAEEHQSGEGMVLELFPERRYKTGSRFGSATPPEGYTEDVQVVAIELMPAPAVAGSAVRIDAREEKGAGAKDTEETVTLSPEALDVLAGTYGEGRRSMLIRSDGEHLLFSNPDDPESEEWTLYPLSEKDFWADFDGTRIEMSFSRDDEGRVFAVTIKQGGGEMTLPRQP